MKRILGMLILLTQIHAGFLFADANNSNGHHCDLTIAIRIGDEPIFYPNPVKEVLYLKKSAAYLIRNSAGLIVKQGFGSEIRVADLPKGTYTLEVKGKSDTFIKE